MPKRGAATYSHPSHVAAMCRDTLPLGGNVFIFRGRRGDLVKVLWATEDGLWLLARRLERGRFVWPQADGGKIHLTSAQLSMLLEGIDWRQPRRTAALSML